MVITDPSSRIGGVFELPSVLGNGTNNLRRLVDGDSGQWLISGRGALSTVLSKVERDGVTHVHIPSYLCSSILDAVKWSGMDYSFYKVAADLSVDLDPLPGSAVLLIHYFGWLNPSTSALRDSASNDFVIIEDASQATLSDIQLAHCDQRLVIRNPRKFGPVPVGAWCSVAGASPQPGPPALGALHAVLEAGRLKSRYLSRVNGELDMNVEAAFLAPFTELEKWLDKDPGPYALPEEFLRLLSRVNWESAAQSRISNWALLSRTLGPRFDQIMGDLPEGVVPLGLPVQVERRDHIRQKLSTVGILCPVHWHLPPEVSKRRFPDSLQLSERILTLPIDQRYGEDEMTRLALAINDLV